MMRYENGEMYLGDPDPSAGTPAVPNSESLCLDIHNNLRSSPRLCLWAVERKLQSTYEKPAPGTFAEFALKELKQYVESRSELHDNFYKHLVINTQTRTFEDVNYVNSIGSKVVIRPLAETFELSAKKDLQLQRTVVLLDPASASQDAMATGDPPPGEIPEAKEEAVAAEVILPEGEQAVEQPLQHVNMSVWTERMEQTMDHYFKKVLENIKGFVRQFQSISYLDLKYLRDTIGGLVDLAGDVLRKQTELVIVVC